MGFPDDDVSCPVLLDSRTSGWISQWEEMLLDPEQKIARPARSTWNTTRAITFLSISAG